MLTARLNQMLAGSAVLVNGTAEVLLNVTRPSAAATFGIAASTNLSASSNVSAALGLYMYISYTPGSPHSAGLGIATLGASKSHRHSIHATRRHSSIAAYAASTTRGHRRRCLRVVATTTA